MNAEQRILHLFGCLILITWSPKTSAQFRANAADASTAKADLLLFQNQDRLHGKLKSADETRLFWDHFIPHHNLPAQPMQFPWESVREIILASDARIEQPEASTVTLTNGDRLSGQLAGFRKGSLQIRTRFAGELAIPRAYLKTVVPTSPPSPLVYEGPDGLDGWLNLGPKNANTESKWIFEAPYFRARGSLATLGRSFSWPDLFSLQFESRWETSPAFRVILGSDYADHPLDQSPLLTGTERLPNTASRSGPAFSFKFIGTTAAFHHGANERGAAKWKKIGSNAQNLLNGTDRSARIDIRGQWSTGQFFLIVDDRLVGQWKAPDSFKPSGQSLVFAVEDDLAVSLGAIRLEKWDGRTPINGQVADVEVQFIHNNDRVSGNLSSINETEAMIDTSYQAGLKIPLAKVGAFHFS
ncbi:MAG: hypothetical protein AAF514_23040, partial [Verrucomicrobiota bacterium]